MLSESIAYLINTTRGSVIMNSCPLQIVSKLTSLCCPVYFLKAASDLISMSPDSTQKNI
jgi:hypothetical protein